MTLSTARTTPISSTTRSARAQPLRARRAPPRAADSSADATRRGALTGAAALLLAPTWAPDARAIVSGYDKDTGGYSYAVLAHETPSFVKWKAFFDEAWGEYGPPEFGVVRTVVLKGKGTETRGDKVAVVIVFPNDKLNTVSAFYDQEANPLWAQGRADGWLTGTFSQRFAEPLIWRGFPGDVGAPPSAGKAIALFETGLTIPFDDWLPSFTAPEVDLFHDKMGVIGSEAGLSLKGSDAGEGNLDVAHWFSTYGQAARFCKDFNARTGEFAFIDTPDAPYKEPIAGTPYTIVDDIINFGAFDA